jgi:hypothetical protein
MARHIEVHNLPSIMTDNEEAVEQTKSHCQDSEKIHGCDSFAMVPQKCEPSFRGLRISWNASYPTRNRSFGNIEPGHQEFPVNSRRAPSRIINDHSQDQITNFFRDSLPANHSSSPRDRTPIQFESSAMPADKSFRFHDYQSFSPSKQIRQKRQNKPSSIIGSPGLDLAL